MKFIDFLYKRFKNKYFWISLVALVVQTLKLFGIEVIPNFEENVTKILDIIFMMLIGIGVTVDTSTQGIKDIDNNK